MGTISVSVFIPMPPLLYLDQKQEKSDTIRDTNGGSSGSHNGEMNTQGDIGDMWICTQGDIGDMWIYGYPH